MQGVSDNQLSCNRSLVFEPKMMALAFLKVNLLALLMGKRRGNNGFFGMLFIEQDSVQRPRVGSYDLKIFLCIFWNSGGLLHDRLLEMSLVVTPYVNYHRLTQVAN